MAEHHQQPQEQPAAVSRSGASLQRKCACGSHAHGGVCESCRRLRLQRAPGGPAPDVAPPAVYEVLRSPGQPLDDPTRTALESRFGHDFSRVRVHTDSGAAESARSVNALAYTVGEHIVFAAGQYAPATPAGRRLLAHELTHTVQQAAHETAPQPQLTVEAANSPAEAEAAQAAERVVSGQRVTVRQPAAPRVARFKVTDYPANEVGFQVKLRRINHLLSYGLFDWAITDKEALEALQLLESMSSAERATTLTQINVKRLRNNLPETARPRLETILYQTEGARADISQVRDLLSYGLFDWAITDKEASRALSLLEQMSPERRMHALMAMDRTFRRRLYENLQPAEQERLSQMWTEAHPAWERLRQQGDPLEPGDRFQLHAYNPLGQNVEQQLSRAYTVSQEYTVDVPMLGALDVRGLKPGHIAARLESRLIQEGYYRAIEVQVEVLQRGVQVFEARDMEMKREQPETPLEPGDIFELLVLDPDRLQNQVDLSGNYQVDRRGYVRIEHLGLVSVHGLTRDELTAHILHLLEDWWHQPPVVWVAVVSHRGALYSTADLYRPIAHGEYSSSQAIREQEAKQRPIPERREIDIYLDFSRQKLAELEQGKLPQRDRQLALEALIRYNDWLSAHSGDDAALAATSPWEVYGNIHTPLLISAIERESREKVLKAKEEAWEKENRAAVEAKLDEYMRWAYGQWAEAANIFKSAGPAHLITEHPYRKIALDKLTSEVLSWAFSNTHHPEFLSLSPPMTAMRLLEEDPHLKTIFEIGMGAKPRLEYFPELDRTRYTLGDMATETLIGFLPLLGELSDASDAITGVSITGHKLDTGDRVLSAVALIIPFVPGSALRGGKQLPEIVSDFAIATGRSADEIEAVFRVAGHLNASDVRELERVMDKVAEGKKLSNTDLDVLDNVMTKLRDPLEELASASRRGEAPKVGKLRADPTTAKVLQPGTAEHMSQRWLEYQVRNPDMFPRITNVIDPKWRRAYETILKNKRAGGVFEQEVLGALGHTKNSAMMMGPDASGIRGFIPDAVKGNPTELVWGQAYHFTEVKGWKDMSNTGNLARMIEYVDEFGGHLEVVFRSASHAEGMTDLSGPLVRILQDLQKRGLATIRRYP